jgi:hypothetical protein
LAYAREGYLNMIDFELIAACFLAIAVLGFMIYLFFFFLRKAIEVNKACSRCDKCGSLIRS